MYAADWGAGVGDDGNNPNYCGGGNAVEAEGFGFGEDNLMKMMVVVMIGCC